MYIKDFDGCNKENQTIHNKKHKQFYPKPRQVWYTKLGVNIWYEADGKTEYTRPVLIIKKIGSLFRCLPLTSQEKSDIFHYAIKDAQRNGKKSRVMLSQAKIIDSRRFEEMLGYVSESEFQTIKKLLKDMYL